MQVHVVIHSYARNKNKQTKGDSSVLTQTLNYHACWVGSPLCIHHSTSTMLRLPRHSQCCQVLNYKSLKDEKTEKCQWKFSNIPVSAASLARDVLNTSSWIVHAARPEKYSFHARMVFERFDMGCLHVWLGDVKSQKDPQQQRETNVSHNCSIWTEWISDAYEETQCSRWSMFDWQSVQMIEVWCCDEASQGEVERLRDALILGSRHCMHVKMTIDYVVYRRKSPNVWFVGIEY